MQTNEERPNRASARNIIFAALAGWLASGFFAAAFAKGSEYLFPKPELQEWGLLVWGPHWAIRVAAFVASTAMGGLVAGLLLPTDRKRIAGLLLGLASVLPYLFLFFVLRAIYWQPSDRVTLVQGLVLGGMATTAVPSGMLGQGLGQWWRWHHPDSFGQRRRFMGLHWSLWILGWAPLYVVLVDTWWTVMNGFRLAWNLQWAAVSIIPAVSWSVMGVVQVVVVFRIYALLSRTPFRWLDGFKLALLGIVVPTLLMGARSLNMRLAESGLSVKQIQQAFGGGKQ